MSTYEWQFSPRFRRNAFGWQSEPAMQRIKEAVSEIGQVARKEPVLAAEGALKFLAKVSPALARVDGSSGAIGSVVNHAIETLVPIIAQADVDQTTRQKWLERLWETMEADEMPYVESLSDFWGELCGSQEMASQWTDKLLPRVERAWSSSANGNFLNGTNACLSAIFHAGRYQELLSLLDIGRPRWWYDRRWGVKALVAMGRNAEAIRYAEESTGPWEPTLAIARACEKILLASGFADEAYARYAIEANLRGTNLATFRAIAKQYPHKSAETILRDLVASQPGQEGKWFATAKTVGMFDFAIELANQSPADPRTLTRAANDYGLERPDFAVAAGMTALRTIVQGHGYEIKGTDVLDVYFAIMKASTSAGIPESDMKAEIRALLATNQKSGLARKVLLQHLAT
jgi:hypothetical protein